MALDDAVYTSCFHSRFFNLHAVADVQLLLKTVLNVTVQNAP